MSCLLLRECRCVGSLLVSNWLAGSHIPTCWVWMSTWEMEGDILDPKRKLIEYFVLFFSIILLMLIFTENHFCPNFFNDRDMRKKREYIMFFIVSDSQNLWILCLRWRNQFYIIERNQGMWLLLITKESRHLGNQYFLLGSRGTLATEQTYISQHTSVLDTTCQDL